MHYYVIAAVVILAGAWYVRSLDARDAELTRVHECVYETARADHYQGDAREAWNTYAETCAK